METTNNQFHHIMGRAAALGWTCAASGKDGERFVHLGNTSPGGETFILSIPFSARDPEGSFLENLEDELEGYDPEANAEALLVPGTSGLDPQAVLDDMYAIGRMIRQLCTDFKKEVATA